MEITYPFYGIVYNDQCLKEENFLYTKSELQTMRPILYKSIEISEDGYTEGAFDASHTFDCYLLQNEDEVKDFLTGGRNCFPLSEESEDYEASIQDWYWESSLCNDLFGISSGTLRKMVDTLKIDASLLRGHEELPEDYEREGD